MHPATVDGFTADAPLADMPADLTYTACLGGASDPDGAPSDVLHLRLPSDAREVLAEALVPATARVAWRFFQGRTIDDRAWQGAMPACP